MLEAALRQMARRFSGDGLVIAVEVRNHPLKPAAERMDAETHCRRAGLDQPPRIGQVLQADDCACGRPGAQRHQLSTSDGARFEPKRITGIFPMVVMEGDGDPRHYADVKTLTGVVDKCDPTNGAIDA